MSETSDPGAESERGEEQTQPEQIVKIKADNEKPIEKIKADNEKKIEIKEFKLEKEFKNEKFEKNELKELKNEKLEKEHKEIKPEHKEGKLEKELKVEKLEKDKPEIKEHKPEIEKQQIEGPADPTRGVDPAVLSQHADALEEAARQLRHFIEQSERPDLSRGALKDEPDQGGDA